MDSRESGIRYIQTFPFIHAGFLALYGAHHSEIMHTYTQKRLV